MSSQRLRVLLGKPGLDGHDIGIKVVASALRDAGFEVIFAGIYLTPDEIVSMAVQEAVDVIGLNVMSGCHMVAIPDVLDALKRQGLDLPVILGGIIPPEDVAALKARGVAEYFGPGSATADVVRFLGTLSRRQETGSVGMRRRS